MYSYERSNALLKRAGGVIPGGIHGHMSPKYYIPQTDYPFFVDEAKGSRFRDVDGNEFIDYMCGYGPMVLGYGHPKVEEAAAAQRMKCDTATAPAPVMIELAERLVDLIPIADWALFGKNGNDATGVSLMVARAATGRKKVVFVKGSYHGSTPWAQPAGRPGVTAEDLANILTVDWNDYTGFENLVNEHSGEIAALLSTPYYHPTFRDSVLPAAGYWQKMEALCRKKGIVLIVDDVRCGFRIDLRGSHERFGFKPDMVCFSKAIANGYPLSALVGTDQLKRYAEEVFCTGSFWCSAVPMAAALATLEELSRIDGPRIMQETGKKLLDGMAEVARHHGFNLRPTGIPSMPYLRVIGSEEQERLESQVLHQRWCGECTKRGAFFASHHNWFISTAHEERDVSKTIDIVDEAFASLKNHR
ncbi:MAG TPA: aminotransferase class III-fold pyridoxal phosphate-dependent enzyme [Spirochaetia bacterium]|nr:aminotransferase class III-fold pyridoxal phosphate-dependent enzyme [Spirochaetia bacterium]